MIAHAMSNSRFLERLPFDRVPAALKLGVVIVLVALSFLLRQAAQASLPFLSPFTTFFSVIVVAAFLFGVRWGLAAYALSVPLGAYYFLAPLGSATMNSQAFWTLGTFSFNVFVALFAISWLQQLKRRIVIEREAVARLAETRELLFRELQHRVSNNLQMVAALLTVQQRKIADPKARLALEEASRRLGVIGRISRQLYDPSGSGQALPAFLDQLARDVIETSGRDNVRHYILGDPHLSISPEAAIPLALVVAETVANSIEHGFAGREDACRLDIRVSNLDAGNFCVEVEDDGHGLPDGFDLEQSDSLGLKIATMLANQLGGSFSLQRGRSGTLARLELPLAA